MSERAEQAIKLFKEKKYKEAIDAFSLVLETEPDNANYYNNIGLAYANLGNFEQAEKFFLKAQELDPEMPHVYINLSDLYYKKRDYASAIGTLERGSYELPQDMTIAHLLARVYIDDSRYDMAINELEKVLDAQPENYDAYYDLGRVNFELGNYDAAITNFENVLSYKDNELVYYNLAEAYEANNEIDKAISNYLRATAVNEKFHPAFKKLGILFLARELYRDAYDYFNEYIELDIPEEEKKSIKLLIERIQPKL